MSTKPNVFKRTREANLYRNQASDRYYGRFTISGKPTWINLNTDIFTTAKLRLADHRAKIERNRIAFSNVECGAAKMGELVRLYRVKLTDKIELGESTRTRYLQSLETLLKTWPDFDDLAPEKITPDAVTAWRNRISRDGTGFVMPGAKHRSQRIDGSSGSTINKSIDTLRSLLGIAVERGQLASNPLAGRGIKMKANSKKPKLPDSATLSRIFDEIEKGSGNAKGPATADFCRFLAYTGCRLSEARGVTWADVDFGRGILFVRGTKTEAANREVPLIPAARALLDRLYLDRKGGATVGRGGIIKADPKADLVLTVGEAGKSLVRACGAVGAPVLTHHDLRDAFATATIEAGVDIPTVAAWLGHADGGALLMKVYAHHRRPHSLAQAAKVMVGI